MSSMCYTCAKPVGCSSILELLVSVLFSMVFARYTATLPQLVPTHRVSWGGEPDHKEKEMKLNLYIHVLYSKKFSQEKIFADAWDRAFWESVSVGYYLSTKTRHLWVIFHGSYAIRKHFPHQNFQLYGKYWKLECNSMFIMLVHCIYGCSLWIFVLLFRATVTISTLVTVLLSRSASSSSTLLRSPLHERIAQRQSTLHCHSAQFVYFL